MVLEKGREIIVTMSVPKPRKSGFTVLELIVAIAIAMIVLGIAVPSFMTWLPTLRLSSGARQVATDLQVARMKAISQNTKFRINFGTLPASTYVVEKDSGGFSADSGPFSLPEGITVTAVSATSEFQPRGTASATSTITLQNVNSETKSVQIAIVGRVTIP